MYLYKYSITSVLISVSARCELTKCPRSCEKDMYVTEVTDTNGCAVCKCMDPCLQCSKANQGCILLHVKCFKYPCPPIGVCGKGYYSLFHHVLYNII